MKKNASGMVLSGIDNDQYTSSNGVPIESRVRVEPLDMTPWIGSGEAAPAMFGQSIVSKLPEPVKEILTTPAPSSMGAMAAVTVGGAVASHLLGAYGHVRPGNRALLGVAMIAGGHYLAKSWEAKSVGWGALAEGVAGLIADKIKERSAARAATQAPQGAVAGGASSTAPVGGGPVIEEGLLLRQIEEGTVELPGRAPSGAVEVPTSDEAALDPRAMGLFLRELSRRRHTKLTEATVVRLIDGRTMSIGQYLQEFSGKVEGARQQGLMRRSRRARADLPMQSEFQFLRTLINRCMARLDAMAEGRLPSESPRAASSSMNEFLAGAPEGDVTLFDGTVRPATAYASEFPERIEWAMERCRQHLSPSEPVRPAATPPATPPATPAPESLPPTLIQMTGERAVPGSSTPQEIRPVTTISANASTVTPNTTTLASNLIQANLTVRPPPFRRL
jgi:hypothetical protein